MLSLQYKLKQQSIIYSAIVSSIKRVKSLAIRIIYLGLYCAYFTVSWLVMSCISPNILRIASRPKQGTSIRCIMPQLLSYILQVVLRLLYMPFRTYFRATIITLEKRSLLYTLSIRAYKLIIIRSSPLRWNLQIGPTLVSLYLLLDYTNAQKE